MAIPRGVICPLFSDGKNKIDKSQSLLCCIAIGKEVARDKTVLNSVSGRKNFFHRLKRKLTVYHYYHRSCPPCCLENLSRIEQLFAVRLYIWRKVEQYEIMQIYESQNPSCTDHRVNILSLSSDNSDLSELYYVWNLSTLLTVFETRRGDAQIIQMDLFRALAQYLNPAANSEEIDQIEQRKLLK